MRTNDSPLPANLKRMANDVNAIAARFARDEATREDLRQEMFCHLVTLPPDKPRRFYLRVLNRRAFNYWARNVLDAPMRSTGDIQFDRRTICVGGLRELDKLSRRAA